MTFLMGWPLLLSGILLASIPVVIHLLHRQRTTPIRWGAMRFLLESQLQSRRRRRVDQWLLLAVRVAALLLLAWALARPMMSNGITSKLGTEAPTDVAFVVDHSLSMSRVVGDQTLFDQAAAIAVRAVRSSVAELASIREVLFCCFSPSDLRIYERVLNETAT